MTGAGGAGFGAPRSRQLSRLGSVNVGDGLCVSKGGLIYESGEAAALVVDLFDRGDRGRVQCARRAGGGSR